MTEPKVLDLAAAARAWRIKINAFLIVLFAILATGSGNPGWIAAILYCLVTVAGQWATYFVLLKVSPDLIIERAGPMGLGTKQWDKVLVMLIAVVLPFAVWIVAALDERFRWSPVGRQWQAAGFLAITAGLALVVWAMASNRFFSATVRIQSERGHSVSSGGPYAYVRHPGYTGLIVWMLATPVALGGLTALPAAGLFAVVLIVRTVLEDRTLRAELPGYLDYARKVRQRLVPFVW